MPPPQDLPSQPFNFFKEDKGIGRLPRALKPARLFHRSPAPSEQPKTGRRTAPHLSQAWARRSWWSPAGTEHFSRSLFPPSPAPPPPPSPRSLLQHRAPPPPTITSLAFITEPVESDLWPSTLPTWLSGQILISVAETAKHCQEGSLAPAPTQL